MPMLVAASARPMKNDVRLSYPSAAASANPATIGRTMPRMAVMIAGRPTANTNWNQ